MLVNHPDPSKVAKQTRDNRGQRVGLTEWLGPPQSTREKEWTMPLILFSDSTTACKAQVKKLEVPISTVAGETSFPAVPLTWSDSQAPTPEKEKASGQERPTKGANLALMYDLLQADSQE